MVRIDKFIWCVRLCKTRSIASDMVKTNKVSINGEIVKPSKEIKIGDLIQVKMNTAIFTYKVIALLDKRIGAKLVEDHIQNVTSLEELEKYKEYQLAQSVYRQNGMGKPSKKDRRSIDKFFNE